MTDAELLAQVEGAIQAILAGAQSYQIGDRRFTKADIAVLKAWRDELRGRIEASGHTYYKRLPFTFVRS